MDILFDNPLAAMDGIYFLILYVSVIVFTVTTLGFSRTSLDETDRLGIPAIPPHVDPFETAYLRGGPNELARTIVFSLRQKGAIVIANGEKVAYLRPAETTPRPSLTEIEQKTLGWIGYEREVGEMFSRKNSLVNELTPWTDNYNFGLERRQLLWSRELANKFWRRTGIALSIIAGLGLYKIAAALTIGQFNIFFTILLMIGGMITAGIVGRRPHRTKLGDAYLDRLRLVFEPTKYSIESLNEDLIEKGAVTSGSLASVDPVLISVGIFGTAALTGVLYPDVNEAFGKSQQDSGSSGGGSSCGSSCSSGSSSCGSGCGGCGGGCGG
jgi:uncharacterized protein (TIGR04222 family)